MQNADLLLINGTIYEEDTIIDRGFVVISNGKIVDIGEGEPDYPNLSADIIDAKGNLVVPGFIDIHVNGGGGSLAIDGTYEAIYNMSKAHAKFGTTSIVPTTISTDKEKLLRTMVVISEAIEKPTGWANILGIHLEGPFLNPKKAGAHNINFLEDPSIERFEEICVASNHNVKILSLAPELEGAIDLIKYANEKKVITSLAHSDANYEITKKAVSEGLKLCAHIFNAMPPLHHREPGPAGVFLNDDSTFVEIISDGYHVHPAVMEVIIKSKTENNVILITDAVTPAGTSMTSFDILGVTLNVKGNSCFTPSGNLAGSALTLNKAIKVLVENTSISLESALRMASFNPAKLLKLDDKKGSIKVGKDADVVILDKEFNALNTIIGGKLVY